MSLNRIQAGGLQVAEVLYQFINEEAMPETGIERDAFWDAFGTIVHDLAPKNAMLLQKRDDLQAVISKWHRDNAGKFTEMDAYENFLRDIGYIVPEGHCFSVTTENVDPEIADIAGPQLVVPITNARYALNAANARWGSLYDALYGTDAISEEGGAAKGPGVSGHRSHATMRVPPANSKGRAGPGRDVAEHLRTECGRHRSLLATNGFLYRYDLVSYRDRVPRL